MEEQSLRKRWVARSNRATGSNMVYKPRKSRRAKVEEKRSIRQAIFFGFLTIALILLLLFLGIPSLIKMAVFLGNLHSTNRPIETKEGLPPPPPHFQAIPEATNSGYIHLAGFAQEGSTVKIFLNGKEKKEITTNTQGDFSVNRLPLKKGTNKISAVAVDKLGKESRQSEELIITFDNEPPTLQVISPKDQEEFFDKDKEIIVEGQTEEEASVTINGKFVIVDSSGNFQTTLELKEGENEITIAAYDKAENKIEEKIKVKYTP